MIFTAGSKLGHEILSAIGAGGQGEVYKARDTRLNRAVAIKVLPSHFSDNAEMKARFEREAQTIAGLNHPHICVLYDVGHQDGTTRAAIGILRQAFADKPIEQRRAQRL